MSADDPTDDELEREARADVPLPQGGNLRHSPRLSGESRAINPRALLMAEAEAQSQGPRQPFDRNPNEQAHDAWRERERREVRHRYEAAGPPPGLESGRSRGLRLVAGDPPPPAPPPRAVAPSSEAEAWDRYVCAALGVAVAILPGQDPEPIALAVADRLLEERRRRFG